MELSCFFLRIGTPEKMQGTSPPSSNVLETAAPRPSALRNWIRHNKTCVMDVKVILVILFLGSAWAVNFWRPLQSSPIVLRTLGPIDWNGNRKCWLTHHWLTQKKVACLQATPKLRPSRRQAHYWPHFGPTGAKCHRCNLRCLLPHGWTKEKHPKVCSSRSLSTLYCLLSLGCASCRHWPKQKNDPDPFDPCFRQGLRQIATSPPSTFFHNSGCFFFPYSSGVALPSPISARDQDPPSAWKWWKNTEVMGFSQWWTHWIAMYKICKTPSLSSFIIINYHWKNYHQLSYHHINYHQTLKQIWATKDLHFQSERLPGKLQAGGQPWIPSLMWLHIKQARGKAP